MEISLCPKKFAQNLVRQFSEEYIHKRNGHEVRYIANLSQQVKDSTIHNGMFISKVFQEVQNVQGFQHSISNLVQMLIVQFVKVEGQKHCKKKSKRDIILLNTALFFLFEQLSLECSEDERLSQLNNCRLIFSVVLQRRIQKKVEVLLGHVAWALTLLQLEVETQSELSLSLELIKYCSQAMKALFNDREAFGDPKRSVQSANWWKQVLPLLSDGRVIESIIEILSALIPDRNELCLAYLKSDGNSESVEWRNACDKTSSIHFLLTEIDGILAYPERSHIKIFGFIEERFYAPRRTDEFSEIVRYLPTEVLSNLLQYSGERVLEESSTDLAHVLTLISTLNVSTSEQVIEWLDRANILDRLLVEIKERRMLFLDTNRIINAILRPQGGHGDFVQVIRSRLQIFYIKIAETGIEREAAYRVAGMFAPQKPPI